MSHLSDLFGDGTPAHTHVHWNGYTLCPGCSKGLHRDHSDNKVCQCDVPGCATEEAA